MPVAQEMNKRNSVGALEETGRGGMEAGTRLGLVESKTKLSR